MNTLARKAVAAVDPRPAATTLLLRDGRAGLELLMVRRSQQASFMPGAHVFPGGAVDAADGAPEQLAACDESVERIAARIGDVTQLGTMAPAYAVGALRECFEECGLWLGVAAEATPAEGWAALRARLQAGAALGALAAAAGSPLATSALLPWARWVTPVGVGKRFDTLFVVSHAPQGQQPSVDAGETTALEWVQPQQALLAQQRGEFQMEFATSSIVRSLADFANGPVQRLLDHAAALTDVPPVHPRLVVDGAGQIGGVLLPGQPGYAQAWTGVAT